jgi:hypothetical protein
MSSGKWESSQPSFIAHSLLWERVSHLISHNSQHNGPIAQFWLERAPDKREVSGSSPLRPTKTFSRLRENVSLSGHL